MLMRDDKKEGEWAASFIAAIIVITLAYGLALGVYLSYRAYCHEQDSQAERNKQWSNGSTEW